MSQDEIGEEGDQELLSVKDLAGSLGSGFDTSIISPFENFQSIEMSGAVNLPRFRNSESV